MSSAQPTIRATDALGNTREVKTDVRKSQVISDKNALGQTTSYLYDTLGRRTRITYPEGNFVQIGYDDRGNVTEVRQVAKAGTPALPDIVESAEYPSSCANPKTCNKPTSTTDALGKVTDYTYRPEHGGIWTITLPAPVNGGIGPKTTYSYTALSAWYRNSSGTVVQAPTPIYKLTGITTCRTTSSCTGSADEVVTILTYEEGSSSQPSNLLLKSVTQKAGDNSVSATTTMSSARGNRVSVDGPLAGVVDTVITRYDLLRRIVGSHRPDPDGAAVLKRRAVRYGYNDDDSPISIEQGTVNGVTDADWAAMTVLDRASVRRRRLRAEGFRIDPQWRIDPRAHPIPYDALGRPECVIRREPRAIHRTRIVVRM